MFAVQVARSRSSKGETNIRITAVDVSTARTPGGKAADFTHVPEMLKQYGIRLERSDGSDKDYRDIFLTMDCVVLPGVKSKSVAFDRLEQMGLYDLYPALRCGDERDDGRTRLNRNVENLRAFHFRSEQTLTTGRVSRAVKVATSFVSPGQLTEKVDMRILAHLLAFQKRSARDAVLVDWLGMTSVEVVSLDDDDDDGEEGGSACEKQIRAVDLEEVRQYHELWELFKDREISNEAPSFAAGVTDSEINAELATWRIWSLQKRDEHRAKRGDRANYGSNRQLRDQRQRSSYEVSGVDLREALYAARCANRPWLPREEYVAQRDARRAASSSHGGGGRRADKRTQGPKTWTSTLVVGVQQPSGFSKSRRFKR